MSAPNQAQRAWAAESEVHGPNLAAAPDPPTRLVMFGAVALSAALSRAARTIGWLPFVVDPRERYATAERSPDAEPVITTWPREAHHELRGLDGDTAVAALTHAPVLDDAVPRSPAFHVGVMGSRRTHARRRERLTASEQAIHVAGRS